MRINNPKNMSNEELLSKIYVDSNTFQGDGTKNNVLKLKQDISFDSTPVAIEDYTAFEVFAHDYDIPVGECEELGGSVNYEALPAKMSHCFTLRSLFEQNNQNIIIDWGDGNTEEVKNIEQSGSAGDYRYKCLHTYSNTGKYIVKIYGNTYYALIQGNSSDPNIVCRIFDEDLPVASHIKNFSSFVRGSKHLLNVNVSKCKNFNKNGANLAMLFQACTNLISVTGFSIVNRINISYANILSNCYSLETTDFVFVPTSYGINGTFNKCYKLVADINDLFSFYQATTGSSVSLDSVFSKCENLYGIIPADKLWNKHDVQWKNYKNLFSGCSEAVRSQAPESWGGTASDDIIDKTINQKIAIINDKIDKLDYTAFEVFAHDYVIPAGQICQQLGQYQVKREIAAGMTHTFKLKSYSDNTNSDVIIDWGDGKLKEMKGVEASAENGIFQTKLLHEYSKPGKYIIKIYGKDYFNLTCYTTNNIICRILDRDLPIASHITDLTGFAANGKQLIYVNANECKNFKNVNKFGSLFSGCSNLLMVKGFDFSNKLNVVCNNLFDGCAQLLETDFVLYPTNDLTSVFNNCKKLTADISVILDKFDVTFNSKINVSQLFRYCSVMTGTVPANKLWNRNDVQWLNISSAFSNSASNIRSQVPVSWGGTNKNIDVELSITDEMKEDYTAFEVFAHDYDIAAGTLISDTELSSCIKHAELLTESIAVSLPAQMTHRFVVRSDYLPEEQNVIVDWGDGTLVKLSDFSTISGSAGDYRYTLQHTYTSNGKYIIKIYGNKYFAIIQSSSNTEPNILCRAVDADLPVASHLKNFSSFCRHSKHLLEIDVYGCFNFNKNYLNISSMFTGCSNLIYALGFSTSTKFNVAYSALFFSAVSLKKTDFCLIPTNMTIKQVFRDCQNLEVDIADILSIFRMPTKCSINTNTSFFNCAKLYGTIPEDVLWNDKQVTWSPTKTFSGCSDEIRAQVPKSWGGTASDDIIQKDESNVQLVDYAKIDLSNVNQNIDFVVQSWQQQDGSKWYRKYKSGWVEQGGVVVTNSNPTIINLPVEMQTNQYTCSFVDNYTNSGGMVGTMETNYFQRYCADYANNKLIYWFVSGMSAK